MRSRRFCSAALSLVLVAVLACASGGSNEALSRSIITGDQLEDSGYPDVYQALRDHPRLVFTTDSDTGREEMWLRGRHVRPGTHVGERGVLLVMDGTRRSDTISILRNLKPREVLQIRILTASEAGGRYGVGSANGVIEITTR